MKAITLTQPYATLIAIGAKRIETRSWSTQYRGPLAIHAARGLGPVGGIRGLRTLCRMNELFYTVLRNLITSIHGSPIEPAAALPRGAIIAVCDLIDCRPTGTTLDGSAAYQEVNGTMRPIWGNERAFGDYTPGRFAWLLANVRALPDPIPARGALGLWEWNHPAPA